MFASKRAGWVLARAALIVTAIGLGARTSSACDLCAIYTATVMHEQKTGPWLGISEQFTSFNTLKDGDDEIDNDNAEWLQSSITQLVLGYAFHPRFSLQLNIPIISREFRRGHDGEIELVGHGFLQDGVVDRSSASAAADAST